MKNRNKTVIALLLSKTKAIGIVDLPAFTWSGGAPPTWASTVNGGSYVSGNVVSVASTMGCIECIRAGYTWCSNKWSYNAPSSTYDPSVEKGTCCFDVDTGGYVYNNGNTAVTLSPPIAIGNKDGCPAVF